MRAYKGKNLKNPPGIDFIIMNIQHVYLAKALSAIKGFYKAKVKIESFILAYLRLT